ncbi:MAG: hypothetical protein AVDCRST_MAG20-2951, partial [uncultured Acidimicrobiales bacterium]
AERVRHPVLRSPRGPGADAGAGGHPRDAPGRRPSTELRPCAAQGAPGVPRGRDRRPRRAPGATAVGREDPPRSGVRLRGARGGRAAGALRLEPPQRTGRRRPPCHRAVRAPACGGTTAPPRRHRHHPDGRRSRQRDRRVPGRSRRGRRGRAAQRREQPRVGLPRPVAAAQDVVAAHHRGPPQGRALQGEGRRLRQGGPRPRCARRDRGGARVRRAEERGGEGPAPRRPAALRPPRDAAHRRAAASSGRPLAGHRLAGRRRRRPRRPAGSGAPDDRRRAEAGRAPPRTARAAGHRQPGVPLVQRTRGLRRCRPLGRGRPLGRRRL